MKLEILIDEAAKACLSQAEAARRLGVSPQRLNDYKAGRVPCPLKRGAAIAELAGLPASVGVMAVAERKLAGVKTWALAVGAWAIASISLAGADSAQAAGVRSPEPATGNV